jgi:hypothetical protein
MLKDSAKVNQVELFREAILPVSLVNKQVFSLLVILLHVWSKALW